MKDLFSGSLGRLNNHGGSRIFTTPNTIYVPPDYEVSTDVPSVAEFVTCSLDGRLWVFRRSRRVYVAVFRWDKLMQRLAFVMSTILSNANIIGRGVDWVLTKTAIIQAIDDEPYVNTVNLFSDNGTAFLYSILRSKELPSGIDPITGQAWGLSESNGNSEGYGYFNSTDFIQSVNKHYSLLPAVGDWNIVGNFLVRRFVDDEQDNPYAEAYNSMLNIRPLIPLEFNGSTPAYGCGFDNDIFLTYFNGELFGRGLDHIGKCYILPAVFDEQGNPQEFYLYISPDYKKSNEITQADWLNLGILKTSEGTYGFLPVQANSINNGLCFTSDNPKIFGTSADEWQVLLNNEQETQENEEEQQSEQSGQMFIDILNNSGLILHDDGAIFLNGTSYECKGLNQWLAPAGSVDAVTADYVMASCDNATLSTYIQQGFYREALAGKKLPISVTAHSGKKFSLGIKNSNNIKAVHVNSIESENDVANIAWENIYKQPVGIKLLKAEKCSGINTISNLRNVPIFIKNLAVTVHFTIMSDPYGNYTYVDDWLYGGFFGVGTGHVTLSHVVHLEIIFFDPETAEFYEVSKDIRLPSSSHQPPYEDWRDNVLLQDTVSLFGSFSIKDGRLIVSYTTYHIKWWKLSFGWEETYHEWDASHPEDPHGGDVVETVHEVNICKLPSSYEYWEWGGTGGNIYGVNVNKFLIGDTNFNALDDNFDIVINNLTSPHNSLSATLVAHFTEKDSNVSFLCYLPSVLTVQAHGSKLGSLAAFDVIKSTTYSEWGNYSPETRILNADGYYTPTEKLHLCIFCNDSSECFFLVFRSEFHPDIFDFKSETERSKLS